jgi:hypothetical protein
VGDQALQAAGVSALERGVARRGAEELARGVGKDDRRRYGGKQDEAKDSWVHIGGQFTLPLAGAGG